MSSNKTHGIAQNTVCLFRTSQVFVNKENLNHGLSTRTTFLLLKKLQTQMKLGYRLLHVYNTLLHSLPFAVVAHLVLETKPVKNKTPALKGVLNRGMQIANQFKKALLGITVFYSIKAKCAYSIG